MKQITKKPLLTAAGAGFLGLCLRALLYRTGFDHKGILSASHPLHLACLVLTAAMALYLSFRTQKSGDDTLCHPRLRFPAGLLGGCFLLLHGITLIPELEGLLSVLRCALALSGAGAMIITVFPPVRSRRVHMLCHGLICLFFGMDMLCRYRGWSGNPQLPDYCFHVLAGVCLSLCSYHRLAFDTGLGKHRIHGYCCLMALYLCLLSLVGPEGWEFYLGGAFWAAACLSTPAREADMYLPDYVKVCMDALENAGFQAWAVGGCVRDALLGLTPNDYDLCTDALPEQTEAVFSDYPLILNGKKHGTVGVILDKNVVEITTFRTEGDYKDNRHPEWVEFVPHIKQDLARRDFTVNAMAYSPTRGFADPFGGREDLSNHILRAVGDPEQRFREDSLRILRGARFAVKYHLVPEDATQAAMKSLAPLMDNLARERVWDELCKLLILAKASDLIRFAPVITQVIPELAPQLGYDQSTHYHRHDLFTHTALVVAAIPQNLALRWAALLHDTGKPDTLTMDESGQAHYYGHAQISAQLADEILLRLKAPTALREQTVLLIEKHMVWFERSKKVIRRWISRLGLEMFSDLITLQEADSMATGTAGEEEKAHFAEIRRLAEEIRSENACLTLKDLAVNGHDLMDLGLKGKEIGNTLHRLLNLVLEEEIPNEKDALLTHVQEEIP